MRAIAGVASRLTVTLFAGLLPICAAAVSGQAGTAAGSSCPSSTPEKDVLTAVEGTGDVLLASGRRIRLVDIRWADLTADTRAFSATGQAAPEPIAWLRSLGGAPVTLRPVGEADRWNRIPAVLALRGAGEAAAIDVAELLVAEGLALVDAGERQGLCRPALLALEGSARVARRGLWRERPLPAADAEGLARRAGRFEVIEGRVVSVGERRERTYLNFGRDFARDVAVVVPKRSWAAMKAAGHSAASLKGRLIRVRGIVEMRRAPMVEVSVADMVEVLPQGAGRP